MMLSFVRVSVLGSRPFPVPTIAFMVGAGLALPVFPILMLTRAVVVV